MLFNSFEFFVFLPVVFILYWFVFRNSLKQQNLLVLFASYFFYSWWSWKFAGLLLLSTLLDFTYGFFVASDNRRKARLFLWLSIFNNLGILAVFKYYNFFAAQVQEGLTLLGLHTNPVLLEVALPVGISFYTFHGMSYVFDIYRKQQQPVRDFVTYAVFVAFFPLLVAGPIERASHLLPQVRSRRTFNYTQAVEGCRLIIWGLFKKVVVADSLAGTVNEIFGNPGAYDGVSLVLGAVAFSFQIYGDFSGYSDIAIGTAKLFGFELLSNFRFPYFSRDVAEFWRRWHISLSSWLRDYLYIPLGGSRQGKGKAVRNTFIVFITSGLWHGANWTYIAWGFVHACAFLPLLLRNRNRVHIKHVVAANNRYPTWKELGQMLGTFSLVTLAWVFFRAQSIGDALFYLKRILVSIAAKPGQLFTLHSETGIFIYILPLLLFDWIIRANERSLPAPTLAPFRYALYFLVMILVVISYQNKTTFLYFQF